MATYTVTAGNRIEINFNGIIPDEVTRDKMKSVKFRWDPGRGLWHGLYNVETLAIAKEVCGIEPVKDFSASKFLKGYALKLKIRDIISADQRQFEIWVKTLKDHVNDVMSEDNSSRTGNSVSQSQESVWMDCFKFIARTLSDLNIAVKEFELVFEYSLPGAVHERPDVFLLTDKKVISLEFKRKPTPQVDDNKDDVAQAIRYKEWLMNHHRVTIDKNLEVKSYLVCTYRDAQPGELREINILTADNFCSTIEQELNGERPCQFIEE